MCATSTRLSNQSWCLYTLCTAEVIVLLQKHPEHISDTYVVRGDIVMTEIAASLLHLASAAKSNSSEEQVQVPLIPDM